MNTSLRATCLLFASVIAISQTSAQAPKKSFEQSAFANYKSLPTNKAAVAATTKKVQAVFDGWAVTTDKLNGMFTDIYGTPVALTGNTNPEKVQNCMTQQLSTLGVNKAEWKQVSNKTARKADYVNYRQVINGHNVVFSRLSFRFTKDGDLARIQMKNYGSPSVKSQPAITQKEAKDAALKDLTDISVTSAVIDPKWEWFPVPSAKGYELHPSWHFTIEGRMPGSVPLSLTGYIDGITGDLLYRTNEIKETGYDLTVKGVVYKNGTLNPATSEALPDLKLKIGSSTYYTDTAGYYANLALLLPLSTDIPLAGKWSTVIDSVSAQTPLFTDLVSLAGTTYTYPTTVPCSDRDINGYYHVNRVHNFMKGYFPAFTGMDTSLTTNIDLSSGTCNAFYNHSTINFYKADPVCHSFAEIGDIIYHEYGHGISDHFYTEVAGTTITNGALNEACSDVWAFAITHSPILGANCYVGVGGFIRRYDITPQVYDIDLQGFDPHKDGQIIAGTWWDVGVNLGSVDSMTKLFTDVYFDVPDGPYGTEGAIYQSILIDALMADDDNSNLLDGTPHYAQIVAAFARHGIYLEGDAQLAHNEIPRQIENTPITVQATLTISRLTYFHDLTMYYRINGTGAWTPVVMTGTSFNFTGTIPAQPMGTTVEYYFIVHDALSVPNAFFPITCNPALPSKQATIPFQFGVGIASMDSMDFESTATGWAVAGNPADNATGGLWHQGPPVPHAGGFIPITAWPNGDHTTGSGSCLSTGVGSSGLFGAGVANGTTSVLSPIFDISTFTTPVVEYYRWFSNEQDLDNFKKDPWVVKIRDASSSTWQTVEYTYQSDVNWRRRIFPVSQYLPAGTTRIQLQFFASDSVLTNWYRNGQTATNVGGLDDFRIYDQGDRTAVRNVTAVKAEIFPNPADEKVQVVLQNNSTGTISLYDMTGKKVQGLTMVQNNNTYSLNTKALAEGDYNLVIQSGNNIQSNKIAVLHP